MIKAGDLVMHRYLKKYIGLVLHLGERDNYDLPSWQLPVVTAKVMWCKEKLFHNCDINSLIKL